MPKIITIEDLNHRAFRRVYHVDGRGFWIDAFSFDGFPRLQRRDRFDRPTRSVSSQWYVDGRPVGVSIPNADRKHAEVLNALDAAVALLNSPPALSDDEKMMMQHIPADYGPPPFPFTRLYSLQEKGMIEWKDGQCRVAKQSFDA